MKQSLHELDAELIPFVICEQLGRVIELLESIDGKLAGSSVASICPPEWVQTDTSLSYEAKEG